MEKIPKKEAFVPEDKQAEFAAAAAKGSELKQESKKLEAEAKEQRTLSKVQAGGATVLGGATIAAVLTGNPIAAVIGAGATGLYGLDVRASRKKAKRGSEEAKQAKSTSEQHYGVSRKIVEEGMAQTPPEKVIEIARGEMEEDKDKQDGLY